MTYLPIPHQPNCEWWFSVYCSKTKIQKQKWRDCGLGRWQEGGKGFVSALHFICLLLTLQGPGVKAWGQSLHGQGNSRPLGAVLVGYPGLEGSRNWREAEFCQGPKASKVGWGRPFVWQLRRGGFGRQDAGLFTLGSPGPSKPSCRTRRLFTQQGGKEPGTGSCTPPCPEWGGEGRLGSCSLSLGVQMETSYSRVSWRQRDGINCWSGVGVEEATK